ncbi:MAG: trypsin-like peptidase domain-containing protein, partial [Planctomycetaceae bacterium]|nr:trypsin-like peptidase domain-containing protein [Planctomycetaceae bacterium]
MTFRHMSNLRHLLLIAVVALATTRLQADDASHIGTNEKIRSVSAAMESSLAGLPELYASASKSIVRIEMADNLNVTGVIVSPGGHIVVGNGFASMNGNGSRDSIVHLSDGRTATARNAGWSTEWRLGVLKISEMGPWPAIGLGSTGVLKAGVPCLVIGYSPRGDLMFDSLPAARLGFIDCVQPTHWFTTTCLPGFFEHAAVVGMDGRLLGVHTCFAGNQSYGTAVDVFTASRDDLFAGKNLDWIRYPPDPDSNYRTAVGNQAEVPEFRGTEVVQGGKDLPISDSRLSEVRKTAKQTTVRLVSKDRLDFLGKDPDRWSGVIVSEDGYILTCAHSQHLPGERLIVRLSDGRDADAVALGTNPIADLALVKITSPGPWPFAEIAATSALKPGGPVVIAGYPALDVTAMNDWSTERTPQIGVTAVRHQSRLLWHSRMQTEFLPYRGGMSGGGVFDQSGRYVAVFLGGDHTRSEVARLQWNDLKQIESIDRLTGLPHPLRNGFAAPGQAIAQMMVEVLVGSRPVSIGTIVDADGWILTKASVLDGDVSCRLPDGSVVAAEKSAAAREHDLALLRIHVLGLSAASFSNDAPPSIAEVLCAVAPGEILRPGIVSTETRAILPEPRWTGDAVEDTPDGPMVSRSTD